MTKIQIEEAALIKLLRSGNSKGLTLLYDNYSAALFGIIIRIVKENAVAEDVLQESFLKIWKNFSKYDETKGRLFTWIVNISRNTAIDKIRSSEFIHENKNRLASE